MSTYNLRRMILKRIFCPALALLVSVSTYGSSNRFHIFNQDNQPFSGLFAGVGVGEVINQSKFSIDTQTPQPATIYIDRLQYDAHQNNNNLLGTVFIGYSRSFNSKYIGVQTSISYTERNNSTSISADDRADAQYLNSKTKLNLNAIEFDVDLMPGYLLNSCTLFYGRVGAAFNKLSLDAAATARSLLGSRTLKLNSESNKIGIRLGAGLEQRLNRKLALRLDYIYTYYGKELKVKGVKNISDIANPNETLLNNVHAKYNDQQVLASLVIRL